MPNRDLGITQQQAATPRLVTGTAIPINPLVERIFLIGYRGAGKSSVARLLAERLGWLAVDADAELESRAGKTIRRIFAEDGEDAFRRMESEILSELCQRPRQVIATGGGVVLDAGNRERLQRSGLVIWLRADAETIHRRLEIDANTLERRPVLTIGGLAEIQQLLAAREPHYRQCANHLVDTSERTPASIADLICSILETQKNADP